MPATATIEVYRGKNKPSLFITVSPDMYPVGYRYSRRHDRFFLVWKPEGKRLQEIDVPIRVLQRVLPETFASICRGYTAGCVEVNDMQLRELGFFVSYIPEVPLNAVVS